MSDVIQFPEHDQPQPPGGLPVDALIDTHDAAPPDPPAGLVVIGVPAGYAALEAHRAIGAGADVMLVSDGVTVADELVLKRRARESGLLLMGPGCETAIIDGIGIGFANVVASGRVGVIATSGDAAQEATVLLDTFGVGVSTCLVTGRRDLSDPIGGISTFDAITRLASDGVTEVILLVADVWSPEVMRHVLPALASSGRPAAACVMGSEHLKGPAGVDVSPAIDSAALAAARLAGARPVIPATEPSGWVSAGHVRGIFSGPGLCAEASAILAERLGRVVSNAPAGHAIALDGEEIVRGHACLDVATAAAAHGAPHPVEDPDHRARLLVDTVADQTVAVVLLDVVLGLAAHPDPAGALVPALAQALQARPSLQVVAHVVGTEADPQVASVQQAKLEALGVRMAPTSGQAARLAAALVRPGR